MAGCLNVVHLIGRVGVDPEIRSMSNGKEVVNFSFATSESWKDKVTGEKQEKTEWHRIVIFNDNLIRIARDYVKKGMQLYLEGSLQTRKYTDPKSEKELFTTEVVLQNFNSKLILLDRIDDNKTGTVVYQKPKEKTKETVQDFTMDDLDDKIPF